MTQFFPAGGAEGGGERELTFRDVVPPSNLLLNKLVASNVYGKLTSTQLD